MGIEIEIGPRLQDFLYWATAAYVAVNLSGWWRQS